MTETPAPDSIEAAKTRRRWISIGETVGILALIISGISLWDAHQERTESRVEAAKVKPVPIAPLVLTAIADAAGETLKIASPNPDRVIQTQTIVFPTALDVSSVDTTGNPRIEAGWFASGLRSAVGDNRKKARLPIGIITHYTDGGTDRDDTALYEIGHSWRARLLQHDVPVLEGITLVQRNPKDLQSSLDARWTKAHPPA